MKFLTIFLILSILQLQLALGEDEKQPILSQPSLNEVQHPYLNRVVRILKLSEERAEKNKALAISISILTGKSITEISNHYQDLIKFVASNIKSDKNKDVGSGDNGYHSIKRILNKKDIKKLRGNYPKAIKNYKLSKGKMKWDGWVKEFGGDKMLALKAIIITNGWALHASPYDKDLMRIRDKAGNDAYYGNNYSMHPFERRAFGKKLNLDAPDNGANTTKVNRGYGEKWGLAYKTVAGMSMALSLRKAGYSDSDILLAIQKASLFYETSDILYDHLGIERGDIFHCNDDDSDNDLCWSFQVFLDDVRYIFKRNPIVMKEIIGEFLGIPNFLNAVNGFDKLLNIDDNFLLTMLLLNYQYTNPKDFEKYFGRQIRRNGKYGERLYKVIEINASEMKAMIDGAKFTLEKSKGCKRNQHQFPGIFQHSKKIEKIAKMVSQVKNNRPLRYLYKKYINSENKKSILIPKKDKFPLPHLKNGKGNIDPKKLNFIIRYGVNDERLIPILLDLLKNNSNGNVRALSAKALGSLFDNRPEKIVNHLEDTIKMDKNENVRKEAVYSLLRLDRSESITIPFIKNIYKKSNTESKLNIIKSLGKIGPKSQKAFPILINALKDTNEKIRYTTADVITKVIKKPTKTIKDLLINNLKDKSVTVRLSTLIALGRYNIRSKNIISTIKKSLKDKNPYLRREAASVLGKLGLFSYDLVKRVVTLNSKDITQEKIEEIKKIGDMGDKAKDAIPALEFFLLDSKKTVRDSAVRAIKKIKNS